MADAPALPPEVLAFLVRTLPPRETWKWLSEDAHSALQHKVALGFRATHEVLRQPAARARLVSHLQNSSDESANDFIALLKIWEATGPRVLEEIRALDDDALIAQLPELQSKHGIESLLLGLLRDEKDATIEAWTNATESEASTPLADNVGTREAADEETPSSLYKTENENLKKQVAREAKQATQWQGKHKEAQARAALTEKGLRGQLLEYEKLAREATRNFKAESNRATLLETKLEDAEKARERAERRARSTLAESETALSEFKTARRQLHRLQQINEELRGQVATELREKATRPQGDKEQSTPVNQTSLPLLVSASLCTAPARGGLDEEKIKLALDRNEETFAVTLRAELNTLRARDGAACKAFLKRVRTLGKWYERVLTTQTVRVLVDASNVARHDAAKKGRLNYLNAMRDELRRGEFFPIIFIADASLPHFIDEPKKLREMIARGEVLLSAPGQQADEVLARQARETGAYVVTNDRNFHFAFAPDFTPARIGFAIEDGVVLLHEF